MDLDTTFYDIIGHLDMVCCPRCMRVAYGQEMRAWTFGIVNEAFDAIDCVCPDCVTQADMNNPVILEWIQPDELKVLTALPSIN